MFLQWADGSYVPVSITARTIVWNLSIRAGLDKYWRRPMTHQTINPQNASLCRLCQTSLIPADRALTKSVLDV